MSLRGKIGALSVGLIIIILVVMWNSQRFSRTEVEKNNGGEISQQIVSQDTKKDVSVVSKIPLYTSVVPTHIEQTIPEKEVSTIVPGTKYGLYAIKITKSGYEPSSIVVHSGDVVDLAVTAIDGTYDFSIPALGIVLNVAKGMTEQVHFKITTQGTFTFQCEEYCGEGKQLSGSLVVLPL